MTSNNLSISPKGPMLVGFWGPQGVGKSTIADTLCELIPPVIQRHTMHVWYEFFAETLRVPRRVLENQETKDTPWQGSNAPLPCLVGKRPRDLLNAVQAFRDCIDPELIAQMWVRDAKDCPAPIVIQPSVRFAVEITKMNLIIDLTREGVEYDGSFFNRPIPFDELDTGIDVVHYEMASDRPDVDASHVWGIIKTYFSNYYLAGE